MISSYLPYRGETPVEDFAPSFDNLFYELVLSEKGEVQLQWTPEPESADIEVVVATTFDGQKQIMYTRTMR